MKKRRIWVSKEEQSSNMKKRFIFRCEDDIAQKLLADVRSQKTTVSLWLRDAIQRKLEAHE